MGHRCERNWSNRYVEIINGLKVVNYILKCSFNELRLPWMNSDDILPLVQEKPFIIWKSHFFRYSGCGMQHPHVTMDGGLPPEGP